jgi:SulP family sulfate permease
MPKLGVGDMWRQEFGRYDVATLRQDALAGLTVAAVALPLALAFGVASGASAGAGLVTAIVAGFVIGALAGAPYQIAGPTGAMSAVLMVVAQQVGLPGVWVAGMLSGLILLLLGILRLGRFVAFIPAPVIAGFTSGIALIIAIGQLDNLLGVSTPPADSAARELAGFFQGGYSVDWQALSVGLLVMALMIAWPATWNRRFPASLLGIILATALVVALGWPIAAVGAIPQQLVLPERLTLAAVPWSQLSSLIAPTLSIAALGAVESLLCGAVASNMTGIRLHANQELVAQGVGNLVIPFFGGVPATAAIARTSVGIRAGGRTRMVSIFHALALLASMFILAPVMSRIPLAALAGVLMVTAWRMNEWETIHYITRHRFKTALATFWITLLATVTLDLTQAILLGALLSAVVFLAQIARLDIDVRPVDPEKLTLRGIEVARLCPHMQVAYLTGPLFFAAVGNFNEAFAHLGSTRALILSMRGVPLVDISGLESITRLQERLQEQGGLLVFAGLQPSVRAMLARGGLLDGDGENKAFWGADEAILACAAQPCPHCERGD